MDKLLILLVCYPFIGALLSFCIGKWNKKLRDGFVAFVTLSELGIMLYAAYRCLRGGVAAPDGSYVNAAIDGICGMGVHLTLDGFRLVYGLVAAFMWAMTAVFSSEYFRHYRSRNRYYLFTLLTLGATMGVFFSADLFTTYIFFEVMSFTSYVWVAQDEREESMRAAGTYLAVAVIGGMVLLMGLFMLYHYLGTLTICELLAAAGACENKLPLYIAGVCTLVGFGAKAGAFPLHIWLPKAHPVAPAPASALLSGILTKSGIFGLLAVTANIFLHDMNWGSLILLTGVLTMFGGAVLAVFSVDLKRTLACSSMSQLGFIMVGIGMQCMPFEGSVLAVRGTLLHMVNHSLLKLVLFMAAGVVFMNLHKLNLNEIRGFGRKKPLLHAVFLIGAFGLACLPLGNGYVSKTLLHDSIVEWAEYVKETPEVLAQLSPVFAELFQSAAAYRIVEWLFLFSGGCTIAYMLKLYIAVFIEKNADEGRQAEFDALGRGYMNWKSALALLLPTLAVLALGLFPAKLADRIAVLGEGMMNPVEADLAAVSYFSWESISGSMISLVIGLLVYGVVVRLWLMKREGRERAYVNRWPEWLDLENLIYRPLLCVVLRNTGIFLAAVLDTLADSMIVLLRKTLLRDRKLPHELLEGNSFTEGLGGLADALAERRRRRAEDERARVTSPVQAQLAAVEMKDGNPLSGKEITPAPEKERISYRHRFAVIWREIMVTQGVIERSMSFGLIMFCIGLVATLIYLLWLI